MSNEKTFGEKVRALRTELNLSQEQLAKELDVSFATINRWEGGKAMPQKAQLDAVQKMLDEVGIHDDGEDSGTADETKAVRPRQRRGVPKSSVLSTKSMEQMLWDAACSVRGEKDAPKFKDYLLPLLFIKRLSDVFDDELQRLSETYGDKETALEILEADHSLVRFYIPPEARWPVVSGRTTFEWPKDKTPKSLGEQLTSTIRAIVKHNPSLAGVIDIVDFNETRNGEREISDSALKGVIETFSDPRYRLGLHDVEPDFLGRCYEYLLRKFAESQGQSAGEFFTPREVGFLMAEILRPRAGEECYDYACGSFGLLVKLQLVSKRLDPLSKVPLRLYGQELTGSSYAIAYMNKIIHDMQGEVVRGDSMRNPKFKDSETRLKKFDVVVANPMWMQAFNPDVFENDPFERFEEQGGVTSGKGDWAWLQHTLSSLKENGRAAVVLDTGAVTRGSGSKNEDKERTIRKWFVENDFVDGVILLPENLFYNTTAAGVIIVLRRNKPKERKGKITLINASQQFQKGAPKNYITEETVKELAEAFLKGEAVEGLAKIISNEEAAKNDFNLSPARYLQAVGANTHRPIAAIIKDLVTVEGEVERINDDLKRILSGSQFSQTLPSADNNIPWPIKQLGDLFEIGAGKSVTPSARLGDKRFPFLRTANVFWGRIDLSKVDAMNFSDDEIRTKSLKKGDLLVCEGGDIGRSAIWNGELEACGFQNHLHRLRPKSNDVISRFFMYYLQAGFTQLGIYEGAGNKTTIPNLSRSRLASLDVPEPEKSEQQKVAALLAKIQLGIETEKRLVEVTEELFNALLHELMTGGIRVDDLDIDLTGIQ